MKTYKAIFNEHESDGVFGISLVNTPAMEGLFVALNKQEQKIQLKEIDKEQRILIGLVLEPEKLIYRFNEKTKEEFNIVFDAETIKNLSYNFFKKGNQKNSTIEHENKIDGVTFVESWIVEDTKKDKSNVYGLSYPKGSWVATMKVDSDEVWNNYVKTGKVQGFSVDAMLDLQEVNLKSNINMSKVESTFLESLTTLLGLNKTDEVNQDTKEVKVEFGSVPLTDEDVTVMYEGDNLEVGAELFIETEEGRIAVPEGEHKTEMGILVVDGNSMLTEIKPLEAEAPSEEAPVQEELNTEAPSQESDLEKAIKSILVKYSEQVNEKLTSFETKLSEVVKENEDLKKEVLEFSKQPSAKPVGTIKQAEATTKKGRILQGLNK